MPPCRSCSICSGFPPTPFSCSSRPASSTRGSARCVAAMHTVAVALLGDVRDRRHAPVSARPRCCATRSSRSSLTVAVIGGTRAAVRRPCSVRPTRRDKVLAGMQLLHRAGRRAVVYRTPPPDAASPMPARSWTRSANGACCGSANARLAAVRVLQRRRASSSASTSSWRITWPASSASRWSSCRSTAATLDERCRRRLLRHRHVRRRGHDARARDDAVLGVLPGRDARAASCRITSREQFSTWADIRARGVTRIGDAGRAVLHRQDARAAAAKRELRVVADVDAHVRRPPTSLWTPSR